MLIACGHLWMTPKIFFEQKYDYLNKEIGSFCDCSFEYSVWVLLFTKLFLTNTWWVKSRAPFAFIIFIYFNNAKSVITLKCTFELTNLAITSRFLAVIVVCSLLLVHVDDVQRTKVKSRFETEDWLGLSLPL